jgi:hypothetical protein
MGYDMLGRGISPFSPNQVRFKESFDGEMSFDVQ